jgi:hypothetical protein
MSPILETNIKEPVTLRRLINLQASELQAYLKAEGFLCP